MTPSRTKCSRARLLFGIELHRRLIGFDRFVPLTERFVDRAQRVPRGGAPLIELDCFLGIGQALLGIPGLKERPGAVVVSLGTLREQLDGLIEVRNGSLVVTLELIGKTTIVVQLANLWRQLDRFVIVGDRFVVVAITEMALPRWLRTSGFFGFSSMTAVRSAIAAL